MTNDSDDTDNVVELVRPTNGLSERFVDFFTAADRVLKSDDADSSGLAHVGQVGCALRILAHETAEAAQARAADPARPMQEADNDLSARDQMRRVVERLTAVLGALRSAPERALAAEEEQRR